MVTENMLSPGQKLKKIRKDLKLNQIDIVGTEITRNLISAVENGKATLTLKVANIVTNNINNFCSDNNINFHLTTAYLLEDINEQEEKKANDYIQFLDDHPNIQGEELSSFITEIQIFLANSNLYNKKLIIFEKLADLLNTQKEFYKSYIFYTKAFENHCRGEAKDKTSHLLFKLGHASMMLDNLDEALEFNNLSLSFANDLDKQCIYSIYFNNILTYKKLGFYDKALEKIDFLDSQFPNLDSKDKIKLQILKANCLIKNKYFNDALRIYKNILNNIDNKDANNKELIALSYCTILGIYNTLKDIKNIKLYLDRFINCLDLYSTDYSTIALVEISTSFKIIGDLESYEEYLVKTIDISKVLKDSSTLSKALDSLIDLYISLKCIDKINNIQNLLLEFISLGLISKCNHMTLKLMNYYSSINDIDSLKSLIYFIS